MNISDSGFDSGSSPEIHMEDPPMSRTHQYRKVMKPLLERKRRARINKCLDGLKDLMVTALQSEGESITKLEKADVLELTVKHLQKLKRQNALGLTPEATYAGRFKAGYASCAQEVSKYMTSRTDVSVEVTTRLFFTYEQLFTGSRFHATFSFINGSSCSQLSHFTSTTKYQKHLSFTTLWNTYISIRCTYDTCDTCVNTYDTCFNTCETS